MDDYEIGEEVFNSPHKHKQHRSQTPDNGSSQMIPYVGKYLTTTWLLRNYHCVNQRVWDSHYELSLFKLYDTSFPSDSEFHMPYVPECTRNYIRSQRYLKLPFYGLPPYLLHYPVTQPELDDIVLKMKAIYGAQLRTHGALSDEFRQFAIRQVARSTKGRTAFDVARIWAEYSPKNFKVDPSQKPIIAKKCAEGKGDEILSGVQYNIQLKRDVCLNLNKDLLAGTNNERFLMVDITTGNNVQYDVPGATSPMPIKSGGFFFTSLGGYVHEVNSLDSPIKTVCAGQEIKNLRTSTGLQRTFAALDLESKSIFFGGSSSIIEIKIESQIHAHDVFNQSVFVSQKAGLENKSSIITFDQGKCSSSYLFPAPVDRIRYYEDMGLAMMSRFGFSLVDPRSCYETFTLTIPDQQSFSLSPRHNILAVSGVDKINVYDLRMGKPFTDFRFQHAVPYVADFVADSAVLGILSEGSFSLQATNLASPLLDRIIVPACGSPRSIHSNYYGSLAVGTGGATFLTPSKRRFYIPSEL